MPLATLPRIIITEQNGLSPKEFHEDEVVSVLVTNELNGENSMTITTTRAMEKGYRILYRDRHLKWNEYVVESITSEHQAGGAVIHTCWCPWSLMHDLSGTYVSSMPGTGGTPATARQALTAALAGTARWTIDRVEVTTTGSASFYRMSGWEALQELVKVWGGEVSVTITVDAAGVVSRQVSLLNHIGRSTATKRFEYGYDVGGITRTIEDTVWTARVIPLGAAQQSTDGGYGRKIDISSVNDGKMWLQNNDVAVTLRLPDGSGGWEYPVQVVENQDMETPADLKAWALAHLEDWTTPKVSYEIDVSTDENGPITISVGDEVVVVDSTFQYKGLRLSARVVRIDEDVLVPSNSKVTISNLRETLGDTLGNLSLATSGNSNALTDLHANLGAITETHDTVSVASGAGTALCSVTLEAGTWAIEGNVAFASSGTGRRIADLATASGSVTAGVIAQTGAEVPAVSGGYTALHTGWTTKRTSQTTVYLNAYQDSGAALSVTGYIRAMRIQ